MKNENGKWAVYQDAGGFQGERGTGDRLLVRTHQWTQITASEAFGRVNNSSMGALSSYDNANLLIEANLLTSGVLADYTVKGILYNSSGTTKNDGFIRSTIYQKYNPSLITTVATDLWESALALKTACGYERFMGDNYSRVGNSLVEDNRWKTETQFKGDMNNFIYGMWGAAVTGNMNVAPPRINSDYTYVDLSSSPNAVAVPFNLKGLAFGVQVPWGNANNYADVLQTNVAGAVVGEMVFSIPLFYRVNWADMCSGEFKYKGASLCKSSGYPIATNIEKDGKIKLKIKYAEKTETDSSVVSLMPDDKIKIYFKNKEFTDSTGTFYSGYKNVEGSGTEVVLNGVEWNKNATTGDRTITLNIPVKKGDSIWMRIDPLTSDGIYCVMTDLLCELVTE